MYDQQNPERISELEARVRELSAVVARLAHPARPQQPSSLDGAPAPAAAGSESRSSRRGMLKLAGAAAAGAAAVAVAGPVGQAAAANGDPFKLGSGNNATNDTALVGKMVVLASSDTTANFFGDFSGTVVGWDTSTVATGLRAGVVGFAGPFFGGGTRPNGVIGVVAADAGTGAGVFALSQSDVTGASPALRAKSDNGPALLVEPVFAGVPTTGVWVRGSVVPDTTGKLWYCTVGGTPGTWVELTTTGRFAAVTPARLYDSRGMAPAGPLAKDARRDVVLRDRVNATTFAVEAPNYVPAGATAIACNVTVVNTVGGGFLSVNPKGDPVVHAATINWSASGQILNNGVTITLGGDREVTVIAGGSNGAQTDFVIDVTGYYL